MQTCINHPAAEAAQPCAGCGRPFCDQCLVEILGGRLCQECKTVTLQHVYERRGLHPLAVVSVVVPLAGYVLCLPIPITSGIGLWLGKKVLDDLNEKPYLTGKSVALVGLLVSGGTLGNWLLALAVTILMRVIG